MKSILQRPNLKGNRIFSLLSLFVCIYLTASVSPPLFGSNVLPERFHISVRDFFGQAFMTKSPDETKWVYTPAPDGKRGPACIAFVENVTHPGAFQLKVSWASVGRKTVKIYHSLGNNIHIVDNKTEPTMIVSTKGNGERQEQNLGIISLMQGANQITLFAFSSEEDTLPDIYGAELIEQLPEQSKSSSPPPTTSENNTSGNNNGDDAKQWQIIILFAFGIAFIVTLIVLAIKFPHPTPFQYKVFRIILALAAAGVGAMIPGLLNVDFSALGLVIRAAGAMGLFVVVYFFNPAKNVTETESISSDAHPGSMEHKIFDFSVKEGDTYQFKKRLFGADHCLYDFTVVDVWLGEGATKFHLTVKKHVHGQTTVSVVDDAFGIEQGQHVALADPWRLKLKKIDRGRAFFIVANS